MRIRLTAEATRAVSQLAPGPKRAVRQALRCISEDLMHPELDWKLLDTDEDRLFRARVGDYRIIYARRGDVVFVDRVMHRREGYGWLERAG